MLRKCVFLAVLLSVIGVTITSCTKGRTSEHPNVLFILLDTLRADHLSINGYERQTSPVLDAFAKENLRFEFVVTAAPWTPPSVTSMLSGLYVTSHGMMPPNGREEARKTLTRVDENVEILPEIFAKNGYDTAAVSSNPWITEEFGFKQGFDSFVEIPRGRAEDVNREGIQILEKLKSSDKPFFLYLHYLDPHDPYDPPGEYKNSFTDSLTKRQYLDKMQKKINLYDGEIKYLDTELGKLFSYLKEKGLYEDLKIVIVADHGEQFKERGNVGHGFQLYSEETRVPLFVKTGREGDSGRVVSYPVSTIDIFPTVLELAKVKKEGNGQAVSLLDTSWDRSKRALFTEISRKYEQRAVVMPDGKKLIVGSSVEGEEIAPEELNNRVIGVFDPSDIFEKNPLPDQGIVTALKKELDVTLQLALACKVKLGDNEVEVKDETLERLRSLGYLK